MNTALIIVITLFIIVFGVFFTILYIWWVRYGKKLFEMFNSFANKSGMYGGKSIIPTKDELKRQINQIHRLIGQNKPKN